MSNDLSVVAYAPLVRTGDSWVETLQVEGLQFDLLIDIGYNVCSFTLTGPVDYLASWYKDGLARHIEVGGPDGWRAYEGFVSRLSLSIGDTLLVRSLDGVGNRIRFTYSELDTTQNPPTTGQQKTATANDTSSQAKYGIKTVVVSGNEATAATAAVEAASQLRKLAAIRTDQTVNVGQGQQPSLRVECQGYSSMLDWGIYEQTVDTGTDDADVIVVAMLAADPNGIVSNSAVNISSNATQIPKYYDQPVAIWKGVQDITQRGRESGGEAWAWCCGIYEGRRCHFKPREALDADGNPESTNEYLGIVHHISDKADVYLDEAGREIPTWQMRPDRLVYTAGLPVDPMYCTQVTWSEPGKVVLRGEAAYNPFRRGNRLTPPEDVQKLRSWFFAKDGDVVLHTDRVFTLGDGTQLSVTDLLPSGLICMWSGAVVDIPEGWSLCDGTGGTPDLRSKFIAGAGGALDPGDTGGADTVDIGHTHGDGSLSTSSAGSHDHTAHTGYESSHTHGDGSLGADLGGTHYHALDSPGSVVASGSGFKGTTAGGAESEHTHTVSGTTGSGSSHRHSISSDGSHTHPVNGTTASGGGAAVENRPAFYALAFIMKD